MALSAERIVETAHELLSHYGLQDVTMRRLAAELGVRPGALYYHVGSKQDVLIAVARRVLRPLAGGPDGTAGAETIMLALREEIIPLRDGGDLLLIAYALDQSIPPVPALIESAQEEGIPAAGAEQRAALLMRFALGALATEQNAALVLDEHADSSAGADIYLAGVRRLIGAAS